MRHVTCILALVWAFVVAAPLTASSQKILRATRTANPPVIDGAVTESQWQTALPILDFTQFDPVEGALPTELTSVRVLYDDDALYMGVVCYDAHPELIVRQMSRRDRTTEADRFTVMIDSYFDRHSAFVFTTNVSGIQSDGVLTQQGLLYDLSWDAVWSVRTRVYRDGWSAEFVIPFNALRFAERQDSSYTWGANFRRYISRKREIDEWAMVPRSEQYSIPHWGTLQGVERIQPPLRLLLMPYGSFSATILSAAPGRAPSTDSRLMGGVDVEYGLARNFTLDATINPDFGQVEVDRAVLNLTVFETLYPEKRPFFVEGSPFFTFGSSFDNTPLPIFFSRRIGRRPSGAFSIGAPPGGRLVENPLETTILGAVKVSGRSEDGFSLGAITAITDEERASVSDSMGVRFSVRTEPRASYNVLRLRQEFGGGSWLGLIGTLAARQYSAPAASGGVDWNIGLGEGTHSIDGYIAGARAMNGPSGTTGAAGRLLLSRTAAEHFFYIASYSFITRSFNINDLGFFAWPHDHGGYVQLLYRENFAEPPFRRYGVSAVPEARWNWDGILTLAQVEMTASAEFSNFWSCKVAYGHRFAAYDDAEKGILGTYRRPQEYRIQTEITSDERLSVWGTVTAGHDWNAKGKQSLDASLVLTVRPATWLELNPSLYVLRTRRDEAAVFTGGRIATVQLGSSQYSLFGDRDLDELDLSLRGTLTFNRTLSLQFTSQLLFARGRYREYRGLISSTRFSAAGLSGQGYDFNAVTFNANVLLRWEFLPGSTVYVVWTQGRVGDSGEYGTGFGTRFSDAFTLPHEDVIFVKLSSWFPL